MSSLSSSFDRSNVPHGGNIDRLNDDQYSSDFDSDVEVDDMMIDNIAEKGPDDADMDEESMEEEGKMYLSHRKMSSSENYRFHFSWWKLWKFTGPGWLMSIAYLDPGNIESDLQAGASSGYRLLWVLFISTGIGLVLQLLAARLGVVTGRSLSEHCRREYPLLPRVLLWVMMEFAIIGSDIQEVVGSSIAIGLLTGGRIPLWGGVLITALDTFLFLMLERKGIRKLELIFASLISIMVISFGVEYIFSKPDQVMVIKGIFVPQLKKSDVFAALGLIGAVIMPHNIYLHSSLVKSRQIDRRHSEQIKDANIYNAIESTAALVISFIINLFVVAVFAATFYPSPPSEIKLENAGAHLEKAFGLVALYVWGVGLLAAGQSSTMTGTYAGQFVMEGFLKLKVSAWKRVLITRTVAIGPAVIVSIFAQSSLDVLNQWLNVLQSLQLPFALIPVLVFTSSKRIMGNFQSPFVVQVFCWIVTTVVIGVNIFSIYQLIDTPPTSTYVKTPFMIPVIGVLSLLYALFILYLVVTPRRYRMCISFLRGNGYTDPIESLRAHDTVEDDRRPLLSTRWSKGNGNIDIGRDDRKKNIMSTPLNNNDFSTQRAYSTVTVTNRMDGGKSYQKKPLVKSL